MDYSRTGRAPADPKEVSLGKRLFHVLSKQEAKKHQTKELHEP